MPVLPDASHRETFRQICALILPAWQNMPCAAELDLQVDILDRVLRARPDLQVPLITILEQLRLPVDKTQLVAVELDFPDRLRILTGVVCGAYYLHDGVRKTLGYDGQQALTLSRGGFGAEELVLKLMEQPKRYRNPDAG